MDEVGWGNVELDNQILADSQFLVDLPFGSNPFDTIFARISIRKNFVFRRSRYEVQFYRPPQIHAGYRRIRLDGENLRRGFNSITRRFEDTISRLEILEHRISASRSLEIRYKEFPLYLSGNLKHHNFVYLFNFICLLIILTIFMSCIEFVIPFS